MASIVLKNQVRATKSCSYGGECNRFNSSGQVMNSNGDGSKTPVCGFKHTVSELAVLNKRDENMTDEERAKNIARFNQLPVKNSTKPNGAAQEVSSRQVPPLVEPRPNSRAGGYRWEEQDETTDLQDFLKAQSAFRKARDSFQEYKLMKSQEYEKMKFFENKMNQLRVKLLAEEVDAEEADSEESNDEEDDAEEDDAEEADEEADAEADEKVGEDA
jgi:hypothetical protein